MVLGLLIALAYTVLLTFLYRISFTYILDPNSEGFYESYDVSKTVLLFFSLGLIPLIFLAKKYPFLKYVSVWISLIVLLLLLEVVLYFVNPMGK